MPSAMWARKAANSLSRRCPQEMRQYFEEAGAVLRSEPVDQQALQRVDAKYGIIAVGPPLEKAIS